MTRTKTYVLTAVAAGLFLFLNWAFADGLFALDNLFSGHYYSEYTIITYLMLAAIIAAGIFQARRLPEGGVATPVVRETSTPGQTDDPTIWKLIMGNAYWAMIWMPIRFFVGLEWLQAGEHKLRDDAWMSGGSASAEGVAVSATSSLPTVRSQPRNVSLGRGSHEPDVCYCCRQGR